MSDRLFSIPELCLAIAESVLGDEVRTTDDSFMNQIQLRRNHTSSGQRALAALARVCGTFSKPALDILWRDLPSFAPVARLLPEHTVSYRVLSPKRWEIDIARRGMVNMFSRVVVNSC